MKISKLLKISSYLSALSFVALFSFSSASAADEQYFTSTDDFKMFTRNQIFLYEPCNATDDGVGDLTGGDDLSPSSYIKVGSSGGDVNEKILSAGHSFGRTSHLPIGVLAGVKTLTGRDDLNGYNPLEKIDEKIGFLKWSDSEFADLKKLVTSEPRFTGKNFTSDKTYADALKEMYETPPSSFSSEEYDLLILAEFFYYHYKNPGLHLESAENADNNKDNIAASATSFIKKRDSSLSVNSSIVDSVHDAYFSNIESGTNYEIGTVQVDLTSSSSSSSYLTSSVIIGDSLTYRSESDFENISTEASCKEDNGRNCYNGAQLTGSGAPLENMDKDNIKAKDGRTFEEGLSILSDYPESAGIKYIILALGSNNHGSNDFSKETLEGWLKQVYEKYLPYRIFLVTNYRILSGEETYANLVEPTHNTYMREIAEDGENFPYIELIDWAGAVSASEDSKKTYLYTDGHPKLEGSKLLANLYQKALYNAETGANLDADQAPCPENIDDFDDEGADECDTDFFGDDCLSSEGDEGGEGGGSGGGGGGGGASMPEDAAAWFNAVKTRVNKYWMGQCGESSFSNIQFSRKDICNDGCSVTAFSMAVSIYYDTKITPATTVNWTGSYRTNPTTSVGVISTMASNASKSGYNLKTSNISNGSSLTVSKVDSLLNQKKMIFFSCRGGIPCARSGKTTAGHYIAIVGIDPSNPNNYLIANSHGRSPYRDKQSFSKDSVLNVIHARGNSGKVLWRAS